jgi:hypothetical protein
MCVCGGGGVIQIFLLFPPLHFVRAALARIHLDDEVRPPYVREAYRLLRKSIIHVDVQDIDLDDGNEESDLGTAKPIANPAEEEHDFDLHPPDEDDDNDRGDDDGNGEGGGGGIVCLTFTHCFSIFASCFIRLRILLHRYQWRSENNRS